MAVEVEEMEKNVLFDGRMMVMVIETMVDRKKKRKNKLFPFYLFSSFLIGYLDCRLVRKPDYRLTIRLLFHEGEELGGMVGNVKEESEMGTEREAPLP